MKFLRWFLLIGGMLMLLVGTGFAVDVVVIAHPSVTETSIDKDDLSRIFQGKVTRWDDHEKIVPVMLKDCPAHELFVTELLDTTPSRFRTYWKQAVFSGRGIPPKAFKSEAELMQFVAKTPGAIGYVSATTSRRHVKELTIE